MSKEKILKPFGKIKGGIKVPHRKNTAELQSVAIPAPQKVIISMAQHIGAPLEPTVKKGDKVFVGTLVGDSDAFVSAPVHSSVSGEIVAIGSIILPAGNEVKTVEILSDGEMTPDPSLAPREIKTPADLVKAAKDCGLVGLGGAGFPAHIKLTTSPEKPIDTLIINAAECEPYITSDYRECLENCDGILEGVNLIKKVLDIKTVIICVEDNKPKAITKLLEIAGEKNDPEDDIKIMKLKSKYPQGAEKMLIYSATKRKLPLGKLPADIGCIVMNVTSVGTLMNFIKTGMPLVKKRITVDGNGVGKPQNLIVPIGTPIEEVLKICEADSPEKVLMGGPMMGLAIFDTSLPVLKQNNAILAFKGKEAVIPPPTQCIHCGRCVNACPMNLEPSEINHALESDIADIEELKNLNTMYCIECGSCSFSCPAKRPLTVAMRRAKSEIRKAGNK